MPTVRSCFAAAAALLALGCADAAPGGDAATPTPSPEPPAPTPESRVGSLSLALQTEDGEFESFSYVITGPGFSRSNRIDVSNSNRISALIEGLPVSSGYTLTLSGKSVTSEPVVCSGSTVFAIRADEVTEATVALSCHFGEAPEEPPTPATAAPLPPISSAVLAVTLLALGALVVRRPRSLSPGPWS